MRICLPCLLLVLAAAPVAAAEVYRWVDDQGRIHYSDEPRPGAERIRLPQANVYNPPRIAPPTAADSAASDEGQSAPAYDSLKITQPQPEASIWDNQGSFSLGLAVEPGLRQGHSFRIYLDGQARGETRNTVWRFTGVDRGTHSIRAAVIDADARVLIESPPQTIHLHQQSVNHPARQ